MQTSLTEPCRRFRSGVRKILKAIIPVALVSFVFILSLFVGAIISSIFVHAVEF